MRTNYLAVIVCATAVAVAGCGSSSKSKSTPAASSPATPSTPATSSTGSSTTPSGGFVVQLNTLCKQSNAAAAKLADRSLPKLGAFVDQELAKYEALTPPAAQKAAYGQFLADIKKEGAALKANDRAGTEKAGASAKAAATKLGASQCAA